MMTVLSCIYNDHNLMLVLVAAVICSIGAWTVLRLVKRAQESLSAKRLGWQFLAAVTAGASIWCTHFVAMLAYDPGAPVGFDPVLTVVSMICAMVGSLIGLRIALMSHRIAASVGGAFIGIAIATMHYTGMLAYRVQGIVSWDQGHLVASIAASVILSAAAFNIAVRRQGKWAAPASVVVFVVAIVALHFTGMAAFRVEPMTLGLEETNTEALRALAMAITGVTLAIIGAALASNVIDTTTQAESWARLRAQAMTDPLTRLPNRAAFLERLAFKMEVAERTGGRMALIMIDLDRFKDINDIHGHAYGDTVLTTLADRMTAALGEGQFVARLGGDEFAAIGRLEHSDSVVAFLNALESAIAETITIGEVQIVPGASFGVTVYPDDGIDRETLITNADLAMYRAKADLSRSTCFYEQSMDDLVRARRSLAGELREAVESEQLQLHYQVQTALASNRISGFEVLLRWTHPDRGPISPAEFIPLAEETGLILPIGEWVLRRACADASGWIEPHKIAVNVSPIQLTHTDLPALLEEILAETGLAPDRLELELTETTIFVDKVRSLAILERIRAMGVGIALDDFGTGYSSLDTLRSFPFTKIKLDRSFMSEVENSPQAKAIIRAVLALGSSLDIPVLAEGIETAGQLSLLIKEGCDEAQGYLLGRPMSLVQLTEMGQIGTVEPVTYDVNIIPSSSEAA